MEVFYTDYRSVLHQIPTRVELLPVRPPEEEDREDRRSVSYSYEPSPEQILSRILPRYIEAAIFGFLLESSASEHASRQRAMKAATDNAEELTKVLSRVANQARQAEITTEISEIVGGAEALMASRANARIKVINAFEPNAPVESFLDRHKVQMIHDAHGPGPKVMTIGATPTIRAGKYDEESFRVVRFEDGRVVSLTYLGDDVAPIPFLREGPSPLEVVYEPVNDGTHDRVTATVTNRLEEAFPDGRVTFVLPAGEYSVEGGRLETAAASDDGRYTVLTARVDMPAEGIVQVTAGNETGR